MPDKRETALRTIQTGDIFHAESAGGASLICLALDVSATHIWARTVTTHYSMIFDRTSGESTYNHNRAFIDSIHRLPQDIHAVMIGLDQKFSPPYSNGDDLRLTQIEIDALKFIDRFYQRNQLPASH